MDKYGIINLTELDKWIADYIHKRDGWLTKTSNWEVYDLMVRELVKLKDQCSNLPSAEDVFDNGKLRGIDVARAVDRRDTTLLESPDFEDYITNYKP